MGNDHRCVMARFEIPKKKKKANPERPRRQRLNSIVKKSDDEKQLKYLELEQEVKEVESKKITKNAAGEMK